MVCGVFCGVGSDETDAGIIEKESRSNATKGPPSGIGLSPDSDHPRLVRKDGMTGYTRCMSKSSHFVKTTISVPNEVYVRATRRAKELGTSRSALFARAVEKELDEEESSVDVIDRINAVVDAVQEDTLEFSSTAARRVLAKDDNAKW